jgi:ATP-binding cassette subfamily B protein
MVAAPHSAEPLLIKYFINNNDSVSPLLLSLLEIGALYVSMSLSITCIFWVHNYLALKITPELKKSIGQYAISHLLQQSQKFFQKHAPGSVVNKIKDLTAGVPELLEIMIEQFIPTILVITIALGFLWAVHWKFALGLVVWIAIYLTGSLYLIRYAQPLSRYSAEMRSDLAAYYVDLFSNILSVRLFSAYRHEFRLTTQSLERYVYAEQKKDRFFMALFFFQGMSFAIYQALSLLLLIHGWQYGHVTAGDFSLILTINIEVIQSLWNFSRDIGYFAITFGTVEQALLSIEQEKAGADKADALPMLVQKGAISYKNVVFAHHKEKNFFDSLTVDIPAGQKVGLVGFSGGGKTTFVQLLLRLEPLDSGQILIDGQDIVGVTEYSLRHSISFIPQEPGLFNRSIFENITYSRPGSTLDEVIAAAKKSRAHQFIEQMPQGYNTVLSAGMRLSGGQRQRIAIARAILNNAPILILDEATSQLDAITEKEIQESFEALMEGRTTLVIAHRLSTLRKMDRILVFDKGQIVQDGTHEQLINQPGVYQDLWQAQIDGLTAFDDVKE